MHDHPRHRFGSREQAGSQLADRLMHLRKEPDVIILAIPKGGVRVGARIAEILDKPFDVLLVGKITLPQHGGTTLGAITGSGVRMLNGELIDRMHLSEAEIHAAVLRKSLQLARRERLYRAGKPSLDVADRTVVLVDDGSTPCATVCNGIRLLRRQHADRIIVAMPAACQHAACDMRLETDEVITLGEAPDATHACDWFSRFPPTYHSQIQTLLTSRQSGTNPEN